MKHQDALDQLARETARARRRLALERALRAGLPFLLAAAAWAAIALVGLHGMLPYLVQSLSAAAVFALLIWLAARGYRAWRSARSKRCATGRRNTTLSPLRSGAVSRITPSPAPSTPRRVRRARIS